MSIEEERVFRYRLKQIESIVIDWEFDCCWIYSIICIQNILTGSLPKLSYISYGSSNLKTWCVIRRGVIRCWLNKSTNIPLGVVCNLEEILGKIPNSMLPSLSLLPCLTPTYTRNQSLSGLSGESRAWLNGYRGLKVACKVVCKKATLRCVYGERCVRLAC